MMIKAYDFWHGKRLMRNMKEEKMWRALSICLVILVCLCINLVHQWATLPSPCMCKMGGKSEFCDLKGDIRVDPNSPIVYYVVPPDTTINNNTTSPLTIRPYARNTDPNAMWSVTEWSIKIKAHNDKDLPLCPPSQSNDNDSSSAAALVFSLAGYCGNMFHFMSDILVPLFATARPFHRQVRLLTTNHQDWFVPRFNRILQALSRYEVVDMDKEQQLGEKVYCFSRLTLGLKGSPNNRELNINQTESGYTTTDFKRFLRGVFSLNETSTATKLEDNNNNKDNTTTVVPVPRLLIINRTTTRVIRNVNDVAVMATELGFAVTVADLDRNMSRTAMIVDSCDVMMGVHGAGLTNLFFLPDNAVLIQVVPYGADWVSRNAFGDPIDDMNLRYLAYDVEKHESSLSEQYPPDDPVFTDREFLAKQGWSKWGSIFLDNQNVTLDLERFKGTLLQALMLLHQ
ncbi:Alpha-1,3-arabinosyltransferase XAT3 [Linum grandiflorum]